MKQKQDNLMYHATMCYLLCIGICIIGLMCIGYEVYLYLAHGTIARLFRIQIGMILIGISAIGVVLDFIITYSVFNRRLERGYYKDEI